MDENIREYYYTQFFLFFEMTKALRIKLLCLYIKFQSRFIVDLNCTNIQSIFRWLEEPWSCSDLFWCQISTSFDAQIFFWLNILNKKKYLSTCRIRGCTSYIHNFQKKTSRELCNCLVDFCFCLSLSECQVTVTPTDILLIWARFYLTDQINKNLVNSDSNWKLTPLI